MCRRVQQSKRSFYSRPGTIEPEETLGSAGHKTRRKSSAGVSKTEGSYKLTPHFTEGSSLISSRFLPSYPTLDTPLNSTLTSPVPTPSLTEEGTNSSRRYCSLISPVVLRRLTGLVPPSPQVHLHPHPLVKPAPHPRRVLFLLVHSASLRLRFLSSASFRRSHILNIVFLKISFFFFFFKRH